MFFSRSEDMFKFFRGSLSGGDAPVHERTNRSYWAEKLQSCQVNQPALQYSPSLVISSVIDYVENHIEYRGDDMTPTQADELRRAVVEDVLHPLESNSLPENAERVAGLAYEFEHNGFSFNDFFDVNLMEPSTHFSWICSAIAQGVDQYFAALENSLSHPTQGGARTPSMN